MDRSNRRGSGPRHANGWALGIALVGTTLIIAGCKDKKKAPEPSAAQGAPAAADKAPAASAPSTAAKPAVIDNGHRGMRSISEEEVASLMPAPPSSKPVGMRANEGNRLIDMYCATAPDEEIITAYKQTLTGVGWETIEAQSYPPPRDRTVLRADKGELALRMMISADKGGACAGGRSIRISIHKPIGKAAGDKPGSGMRNRAQQLRRQQMQEQPPASPAELAIPEGEQPQ